MAESTQRTVKKWNYNTWNLKQPNPSLEEFKRRTRKMTPATISNVQEHDPPATEMLPMVNEDDEISCDQCDASGFASKLGLKIHKGRMHKDSKKPSATKEPILPSQPLEEPDPIEMSDELDTSFNPPPMAEEPDRDDDSEMIPEPIAPMSEPVTDDEINLDFLSKMEEPVHYSDFESDMPDVLEFIRGRKLDGFSWQVVDGKKQINFSFQMDHQDE